MVLTPCKGCSLGGGAAACAHEAQAGLWAAAMRGNCLIAGVLSCLQNYSKQGRWLTWQLGQISQGQAGGFCG